MSHPRHIPFTAGILRNVICRVWSCSLTTTAARRRRRRRRRHTSFVRRRWVLEGKGGGDHRDGGGWTAIHSQLLSPSQQVPTDRHASTPTFACSGGPAGTSTFARLRLRIIDTRDSNANCTQVEEVC